MRFVIFGILYYDIEIKLDFRNDVIFVWVLVIDFLDGKGKNYLNKNKVVKLIFYYYNYEARCLFVLILFLVDEYVNIVKEKYGYNIE